MIPVEQIYTLPALNWSDTAIAEMAVETQSVIGGTDLMFQVGEIAAVGLTYYSFVQPPWMWFALARGATLRDLLDFRRLTQRIPIGTTTAVREGWDIGRRFVECYGFQPTLQVVDHYGTLYHIFRKVR